MMRSNAKHRRQRLVRIVDRKTFLSLPAGTAYCKGKKWYFESLAFKGESLPNDWLYIDPAWVDANDSGEAFDRLEEMLESNVSYPMETDCRRDGLFDEAAVFMVFEDNDLKQLFALLAKALSVGSQAEEAKANG